MEVPGIPMILADDNQWEDQVVKYLREQGAIVIRAALPVDYAFYGVGKLGKPTIIGAERKKMQDLSNSARGGKGKKGEGARLVHQYRRAREWGCESLMLMVEDIIRPQNPSRELQRLHRTDWESIKPPMQYRDLDNFLNTLFWVLGIHVKRSSDPWETSQQLIDAWWWWQEPIETHTSWARFDESAEPALLSGKVPLVNEMVGKLDGIGWVKAEAFRQRFRGYSILGALAADVEEWMEIEGIGEKIAQKVWAQLREPIN